MFLEKVWTLESRREWSRMEREPRAWPLKMKGRVSLRWSVSRLSSNSVIAYFSMAG